jgi:adenosylhomocysteinase
MMIIQGMRVEKNPSLLNKKYDNKEFSIIMDRLKAAYAEDPKRWTKAAKKLKGVSEETTTGSVHRLYQLQQAGELRLAHLMSTTR